MRSITKAGLLLVGGLAIIMSPVAASADHGGPHCDELPENITEDHPDWDPSLDADGDGVACESGDAPPAEPSAPAVPVNTEPAFTG